MAHGGDPRLVIQYLREVHSKLPRKRFWAYAVVGVLIGSVIALPCIYLISRDQVGTGALLLDCFSQAFVPTMLLLATYQVCAAVCQEARGDRTKRAAKAAAPALLLLFVACVGIALFAANVRFHFKLYELGPVDRVQVGCKEISDPREVDRVAAAVRHANWFSPISHGWSEHISFKIRLKSGRELRYSLSQNLPDGAAVIIASKANPGKAVSRDLAVVLSETGAWRTTVKWSDYTHKYYYEVVPGSVCTSLEAKP